MSVVHTREDDPQALLRRLFRAAVEAADPMVCVPPHLPERPRGRTVVVGAGKASAAMARAVEAHWDGPLEGLVITRYGHGAATDRIEVVEASHPVPDRAGLDATKRVLELADGLGEDDLLLCLISGGGSALMSAPADGMTLEDKREVNRQLLACGATISEINCVRKHLSAVKGGRLAMRAWPARVVALMISDVPGDDPATIASGPTVADPTTAGEARAVLEKYGLAVPEPVARWLADPRAETPKPGDEGVSRTRNVVVAAPSLSLAAAREIAEAEGCRILDLGDCVEGEAREVGREHAALARAVAAGEGEVSPPAIVLSGGETTVTVRGEGRGGRNAEYALGLALALDGAPGIYAIACDTDGIDGSEDNAGAVIGPKTLARARALDLDPAASLEANDAYGVFAALGDLVVTGPTRTNVNDFRAILVKG